MKKGRRYKKTAALLTRGALRLLVLLLLVLVYTLLWAGRNFGPVSFDEVVFHAMMPLQGTSDNMVGDYLRNAILPAVLIWGILMLWAVYPAPRRLVIRFGEGEAAKDLSLLPLRLPAAWLLVLLIAGYGAALVAANQKFDMISYIRDQLHSSRFIADEYADPSETALTFPERKRNLICLFLESAESSNQDTAHGGLFSANYTPELTKIAEENVSFSQSGLIEGAGMPPETTWTMGGLVAQTAGLPLKLPVNYNNVMGSYEYFLPGATALGDILEEAGYRNFFMCGSDIAFGGRKEYFAQHGHYTLLDYGWARRTGRIPADYHVSWGIEDATLYTLAKEELQKIAAESKETGEPFQFAMLTVDTHSPAGYVCPLCRNDYPSQYANVWACASRQAYDFIEWVKQQDFYENTTVFIAGDHVSMVPSFYGAAAKDEYPGQNKRKVYEAFVNPAAVPDSGDEKNRMFTTLDMFPTILGSLGVSIEGERLGLGTNLFSGEKTLAETYGYEHLYQELKRHSSFYNEKLLFK